MTYVEAQRIITNDITFLAFNYSNEIFIENLCNKIRLSDLEDNKKSISKEITNLNKDNITDEIDKKILTKKLLLSQKITRRKLVFKINYSYKTKYNELKKKWLSNLSLKQNN